MKLNRQDFLKGIGLAGAGMVLGSKPALASAAMADRKAGSHGFALGLTTYTFRNFSLDITQPPEMVGKKPYLLPLANCSEPL